MVAWIALALALGNLAVFVVLAVGIRIMARRYRPAIDPWLALLAPAPPQSPPPPGTPGPLQAPLPPPGDRFS